MPCWTVPCSRVFFRLRELTARAGKENKFLDFDVIWMPMLTHSCFTDTNHQNLLKSRSHHALYTSNWLDFEFAIKNTKRWQETPRQRKKKRSTRACILTRLIPQNIDNNKKSTYSHSVSYPVSFAWLLQVIFAENSAFSHFHATLHRQKLCNLQRVTKSSRWIGIVHEHSLYSRHYHHSADSFNLSSLHT